MAQHYKEYQTEEATTTDVLIVAHLRLTTKEGK